MSRLTLDKKAAAFQLWDLALAELRMNLRSAGVRIIALVMVLIVVMGLAGTRYGDPFVLRSGPLAAEMIRNILESVFLMIIPPVICGAALRDRRLGMEDLILSKPPSSATLVWARFLGSSAAVLCVIPVCVVAALIAQPLLFSGEFTPLSTLIGAFRAVPPALFISAIAFVLATFAHSAMVAGLVVALPIAMGAASTYLPPALQFTSTPYHAAYVLLALAVVAAIGGWWESRRQPSHGPVMRFTPAIICLALSIGLGAFSAARWRGWSHEPDPASVQISEWRGEKPPLPDIAFPTIDGGSTRLSKFNGKPLVLVFWSEQGPATPVEAAAVERAWRETGTREVGFATVCITDDPIRASEVARVAGLRVPAIWNPLPFQGTSTGLASIFQVEDVPHRAMAALILPNEKLHKGASALSQPPPVSRGPSPKREWERRLVELGREAFKKLAERKG